MSHSCVVAEIFNVEKYCNIEILVNGQSRSLKVIPFDRLYMVFYYCLLVFYSNFFPKTHRFWDIRLLCPHWRGSTWSWVLAPGVKKLEWWDYRADKEVWRYLQPCGYNPPTWQMDRQTDGHRATAKTALIHSIMW